MPNNRVSTQEETRPDDEFIVRRYPVIGNAFLVVRTPIQLCSQCEANYRHNVAGGYTSMAESCRAYCQSGHKEVK